MIKVIITDVDGVIVGSKKGVNFPNPSQEIISALSSIRQKGIPVILCTAKATYGITEIIAKAHLNNVHITNGGATIIDPLDHAVLAKHIIPTETVYKLTEQSIKRNITTELHTEDNFIVQRNQVNNLIEGHAEIMQKQPIIVDDLLEVVKKNEIVKFFMITPSDKEKSLAEEVIKSVKENVSYIWTHHPTLLPAQFAAATAFGVSKKHAAQEILENLHIPFSTSLGIGDTIGDWNYMELCSYVGVTGHDKKLQELAKSKGEGNYYIGKSADQDGALEIFKYFNLI